MVSSSGRNRHRNTPNEKGTESTATMKSLADNDIRNTFVVFLSTRCLEKATNMMVWPTMDVNDMRTNMRASILLTRLEKSHWIKWAVLFAIAFVLIQSLRMKRNVVLIIDTMDSNNKVNTIYQYSSVMKISKRNRCAIFIEGSNRWEKIQNGPS